MAGKIVNKLKGLFKSGPVKASPWSVAKDRHVVYSPFPAPADPSVRKLGTSWEPHDKYIVVRHGDMPEALGFVKDSQTLYVVCHCEPLADYVNDNEDNKLTAFELAKRLEEDGLSKRHRPVKLYACSGGVGGVDSFASQFLTEMFWRSYWSLELYAYVSRVSSLDPRTGRKTAPALNRLGEEIEGRRVRASVNRIKVANY